MQVNICVLVSILKKLNKKFKSRNGESIDENRNIENIAEVKSSYVIDCAYAGKDIGKIIKTNF